MAKIKNLIFDIECYPNLFWLVTYDIDTQQYDGFGLGDRLLHEIIHNSKINLIGWNNHSYDNLLLNYIAGEAIPVSSGWGAQTSQQVTEQKLYELSNHIINGAKDDPYIKALRFADTAYHSQDIKALLDPMPGLKRVAMRIRFPNVQDLPVDPSTELTDQQKRIVKQYCQNDVDVTYDIYTQYALQHIELRAYLARRFVLPYSKLQSTSEPRTAEYILANQATQHNHKRPWEIKNQLEVIDALTPPVVDVQKCIPDWIRYNTKNLNDQLTEFKQIQLPLRSSGHPSANPLKRVVEVGAKQYQVGAGGIHSVDTPGVWAASDELHLIDADVRSYYPSILLRDQLYPRGYDHYWSHAYEQIYIERLNAKADTNQRVEDHALKIILNATFGKFGSHFSSFYDPTLLIRVTLTGQLALLMLIEACAKQQIEVLSANTDGILVLVPDHQMQAWTQICAEWQEHTQFTLEYNYYKRYARRDVNSYTALTTDGKIKNKGIFTPPDLKHDVQAPIIQSLARKYLLYHEEPVINQQDLTIHDFIFHFSGTKTFKIYLQTGESKEVELTKSNRWYIGPDSLNNQLVKRGGKRDNTIRIPNSRNIVLANQIHTDSVPHDLNTQYYIEKAWELIRSCQTT